MAFHFIKIHRVFINDSKVCDTVWEMWIPREQDSIKENYLFPFSASILNITCGVIPIIHSY